MLEPDARKRANPVSEKGQRVAIFYTKIHNRLLRPLLAADGPPAPTDLREAMAAIDRHITNYLGAARLKTPA